MYVNIMYYNQEGSMVFFKCYLHETINCDDKFNDAVMDKDDGNLS